MVYSDLMIKSWFTYFYCSDCNIPGDEIDGDLRLVDPTEQ